MSSLCLQRQITDFHVLIQRLRSKPQQVQLQTGFSRTLPNHETHMSSTAKTVLNSCDLLPFIYLIFTTIYLKELSLFWPSRCRPKIVRSLVFPCSLVIFPLFSCSAQRIHHGLFGFVPLFPCSQKTPGKSSLYNVIVSLLPKIIRLPMYHSAK